MPRLYISNASYPELREIGSAWDRHRTWWRAFRSALGDMRFWVFCFVQGCMVLAWLGSLVTLRARGPGPAADGVWVLRVLMTGMTFVVSAFLLVTWGGDLIRPHLRRASPICRDACPGCGHQLTGHLDASAETVRCPECGADLPRGMFEPPFAIPRRFLTIGSWWGV